MILSAGLSPAWQQILQFDDFTPGAVNRASQAAWCASGKVVNFALACAQLGAESSLLSAIGGLTGDAVQQDMSRYELHADWIHTSTPTRVCTTLLTPDSPATELVENVTEMEVEVLEDFIDRARTYAAQADMVGLLGSLPAGAPDEVYSRILQGQACRFILDVRGPALLKCLPHRPLLVKPNRTELAATVQRPLDTDRELVAAMHQLVDAGADWVLVTQGAGEAWACSQSQTYRFQPPTVRVLNPIGSGDCLAAGIAVSLLEGAEMPDAIRFGLGAATHNAEQFLPARLQRSRCEELSQLVRCGPV